MSERETVAEIMVRDLVTVKPSDRIAGAVRLMLQKNIGSIVVVDNEKVVGMLTEQDVLRRSVQDQSILTNPVSTVMTQKLITASPETTLLDAFDIMARNRIRRLPVLKDKKLVGILTERDLCRWVMKVAYR